MRPKPILELSTILPKGVKMMYSQLVVKILTKMTQTQKDQMIEKIYEIVDAHFPKKPNDILIDELCDAFDSLCPVTV